MRTRPNRLIVGLELAAAGAMGLLAINVVVGAPIAVAACHHFTVMASPATVAEGAVVTVTVTRDAALSPSQIDLSTVDETAKAGTDYQAMTRTVKFTGQTTQRSFPLQTLDDRVAREGNQTFRLHLSHPAGCAVNPNFVVDPDARVTIKDDAATGISGPSTTHTGAPSTTRTTRATSGATAAQPTTTSEAATTTEASLETTTSSGVAAGPNKKASHSSRAGWEIGAGAGVIAIGGGGGWWLIRRRR